MKMKRGRRGGEEKGREGEGEGRRRGGEEKGRGGEGEERRRGG